MRPGWDGEREGVGVEAARPRHVVVEELVAIDRIRTKLEVDRRRRREIAQITRYRFVIDDCASGWIRGATRQRCDRSENENALEYSLHEIHGNPQNSRRIYAMTGGPKIIHTA